MTLLTTEIHLTPSGAAIIFAADRRITRDGSAAGSRPKIFRLPTHNAGIGYVGLAELDTGTSIQPMSEWIQDFFPRLSPSDSLGRVGENLAEALNQALSPELRASERLGFHLSGFSADGLAEFWYVRNIDDRAQITEGIFRAREDFRSRDQLILPPNAAAIYRNGDTRAHVAVWTSIDESLGSLLGTQSFRQLSTTDDYVEWVKFKMETFACFYERFATESIIGPPIDCFALSR